MNATAALKQAPAPDTLSDALERLSSLLGGEGNLTEHERRQAVVTLHAASGIVQDAAPLAKAPLYVAPRPEGVKGDLPPSMWPKVGETWKCRLGLGKAIVTKIDPLGRFFYVSVALGTGGVFDNLAITPDAILDGTSFKLSDAPSVD